MLVTFSTAAAAAALATFDDFASDTDHMYIYFSCHVYSVLMYVLEVRGGLYMCLFLQMFSEMSTVFICSFSYSRNYL